MKKIFTILFFALSYISATSQTPTGVKTRFPGIWFQWKDTASATSADSLALLYQSSDSSLYFRGKSAWKKVATLTGAGYLLVSDTSAMLANRLKISDTSLMLSKYVRYSDTAHIVANRLKISDTATMLSNRLKISDTSLMLSNRLKISDTAMMLSNRLKISDTTNMLSTYLIGQSLTANTIPKFLSGKKFVNSIMSDNGSLVTITSPTNGTIFGLSRASGAYVWKYNIDGSTSQLRIKNNGDSTIETYNPNGNVDFAYNITANAATLNGGLIQYTNPTFQLVSQGSGKILKLTRNTNAYDWNFNIDGTSSDFYVTNNANATTFSMTTAGAPYFSSIPSYGSTATNFVTSVSGQLQQRTVSQVRSDIGAGTVTSVSALTLGTSGTDLSSSVANSTTTPVITLNVPTASASNRGALSSSDWSTFNSKYGNGDAIIGTAANSYGLKTYSGSSTVNTGSYLGFFATDASVVTVPYADIKSNIVVNSNGNQSGSLDLRVAKNGTLTTVLSID